MLPDILVEDGGDELSEDGVRRSLAPVPSWREFRGATKQSWWSTDPADRGEDAAASDRDGALERRSLRSEEQCRGS